MVFAVAGAVVACYTFAGYLDLVQALILGAAAIVPAAAPRIRA
jgi:hypothetical protein